MYISISYQRQNEIPYPHLSAVLGSPHQYLDFFSSSICDQFYL